MKQMLNTVYETELAAHIIKLSDMYFSVSLDQCQKMAYEFATANATLILSSWERNCRAEYDWFKSFSSRNNLSFRILEATSIAGATAFNTYVVNKFMIS